MYNLNFELFQRIDDKNYLTYYPLKRGRKIVEKINALNVDKPNGIPVEKAVGDRELPQRGYLPEKCQLRR